LTDSSRQEVLKHLAYTEDELARLATIDTGVFLGRRFDIDPKYVSTPEGISQQLDKFKSSLGLLFLATFTDGKPEILKIAASLNAEAKREMYLRLYPEIGAGHTT